MRRIDGSTGSASSNAVMAKTSTQTVVAEVAYISGWTARYHQSKVNAAGSCAISAVPCPVTGKTSDNTRRAASVPALKARAGKTSAWLMR